MNIISVIFNTFFCLPFKYLFNCDSRIISNFEKPLGLSRSLATPGIIYSIEVGKGLKEISFIPTLETF